MFKKRVCVVIIFSIIFLSLRIINLSSHFSHYDDHGISLMLIDKKYEEKKSGNNRGYKLLNNLGLLSPVLEFNNAILAMRKVGHQWTYAPAQYFLTSLLLDKNQTYSQKIISGRFPSFLFSLATFGIFCALFISYPLPNMILGLSLILFSWPEIIYSGHMSPYAAGVFGVSFLLYVFSANIQRMTFGKFFLLGFLPWLQYQLILFIPGIALSTFTQSLSIKRKIAYLMLLFLPSMPLYFYFLRFHSSGINWNAGINSEFLFSIQFTNVFEYFKNVSVFFMLNGIELFKNLFIGSNDNSHLDQACALVLGFLSLMGLWRIRVQRQILTILGLFLLVYLVLLISQKVTLSPTRHSLVFLPIFSYLIVQGTLGLSPKLMKAVPLCLSLFLAIIFGSNYLAVAHQRSDPFLIYNLLSEIELIKPDVIIQSPCSAHVALFPKIVMKYPTWSFCGSGGWRNQNPPHNIASKKVVWIDHRGPLTESTFNYTMDIINIENKLGLGLGKKLSNYKIEQRWQFFENTEVDFTTKVFNGRNGLFLTVLTLP